ncbi:hypothetical protein V6Z12_A11G358800, partial [Gossypium hirsutum]
RYAQRVVWVLKLKGIDYEWVQQGFRDPKNRSQLLLKYNPVMKTVPVLVHHGRPVLESLIILEYIDETWKNNPILPSDPYERAMARFWENLIDQKILDRELTAKGNKFFGGETIGIVDIALSIITYWMEATEEVLGVNIFDSQNYPFIAQWKTNLLEFIQQCLHPKHRLLRFYRKYSQSKL